MVSGISIEYMWFMNRSIGSIDGFITSTTISVQSGTGSNGNDEALQISQISISRASSTDAV